MSENSLKVCMDDTLKMRCILTLGIYVPLPTLKHCSQRLIQIRDRFFSDPLRDAVGGLGNASCDRCQGIAVAAKGYRVSDRIFKIRAFQKRNDRLWYGLLTGLVELVGGTDLIQCSGQIVSLSFFNMFFDTPFTLRRIIVDGLSTISTVSSKVVTAQEDRIRRGHGSLDTLRMIVRHFCRQPYHGTTIGGPYPGSGISPAAQYPGAW